MAIFSALRFISKKRDAWLIFVEFLVARGLIGSIYESMSLSGVTRLGANHSPAGGGGGADHPRVGFVSVWPFRSSSARALG